MASRIEERYIANNPASQRMAARARAVCPGGVSQTSRDFKPFAPFYSHAAGTRKWTIDGQEIVDFCMGHGSLIFGHNHPEIVDAIQVQLSRGTHFASPSEPEVTLAELICELIPCAELVRFTGTGSEACDLALRIARAATGRDAYIKFEGHYHGWHDQELHGLRPPYDAPLSSGLPRAAVTGRVLLPPGDLAVVERTLDERGDIACVMVEPGGGTHGTIPATTQWVQGLRELTSRHGILLVFDEMVTGFRLAPGGYQEWAGIVPDVATLGKTMFGGLPGAAVVGRAELMNLMAVGADRFVAHLGTWNAFPVACAAGVQVLRMLRSGRVQQHINAYGARLRAALNDVIDRAGAAARVYGAGSHAHFCLRPWPFGGSDDVPIGRHAELANDPDRARQLRLALLVAGVDLDFANNISAVHGDEEFERAVGGFEAAIASMLDDRLLDRRATSEQTR